MGIMLHFHLIIAAQVSPHGSKNLLDLEHAGAVESDVISVFGGVYFWNQVITKRAGDAGGAAVSALCGSCKYSVLNEVHVQFTLK